MTQPLHLGLLGAMPEEIGSDLSHLKDLSCSDHGDLKIHRGSWGDEVRLSLAWSGWGKVSAARAATRLLASDPSIDLLVFTALRADPSPAPMGCGVGRCRGAARQFPRFTLPALNQDRLQPQPAWFDWAKTALLEAHSAGDLDGSAQQRFDRHGGSLHRRSNPAAMGCGLAVEMPWCSTTWMPEPGLVPALHGASLLKKDQLVDEPDRSRPGSTGLSVCALLPRPGAGVSTHAAECPDLEPAPASAPERTTAAPCRRSACRAGDLDGFAQPSSGLIATGDRFISNPAVLQTLRNALPDLRAVEMEGAAVGRRTSLKAGAAS